MRVLSVIRYRTLAACMAAYYERRPSELPTKRVWDRWQKRGKRHTICVRARMRWFHKRGWWGWTEDDRVLHLWIASWANPAHAVGLIAHELAHCSGLRVSPQWEEREANRYERVARLASSLGARYRRLPYDRKMRVKAK